MRKTRQQLSPSHSKEGGNDGNTEVATRLTLPEHGMRPSPTDTHSHSSHDTQRAANGADAQRTTDAAAHARSSNAVVLFTPYSTNKPSSYFNRNCKPVRSFASAAHAAGLHRYRMSMHAAHRVLFQCGFHCVCRQRPAAQLVLFSQMCWYSLMVCDCLLRVDRNSISLSALHLSAVVPFLVAR